MILSGKSIKKHGLVDPCEDRTELTHGRIRTTYGLSVAGYDLRLDKVLGVQEQDEGWYIYPGQFVLASAMEKFTMPNDIVGVVHDKSTWARRGLAVQNTVVEPGWTGYLTLELTNHGQDLLHLPKGCGICQVLFHWVDQPTEGYDGKYQGQPPEPVPAR